MVVSRHLALRRSLLPVVPSLRAAAQIPTCAQPLTLSSVLVAPRCCQPIASVGAAAALSSSGLPQSSVVSASTAAFSAVGLPHIRPALLPIIAIVSLCLIGMVPSGVLALQQHRPKLVRRVFTGCTLGVVVSLWIFSSTYGFLITFALMAIVAQNEYTSIAPPAPTWRLNLTLCLALTLAVILHP